MRGSIDQGPREKLSKFSVLYDNQSCLVPVRLSRARPSRSIHFGDVSARGN